MPRSLSVNRKLRSELTRARYIRYFNGLPERPVVTMVMLVGLMNGAVDPPPEAPVVPDAVPLEEAGRYRSTRSFDDTVEYYKRVFRHTTGVRWRDVVSLPGIKAKHIQCVKKKTHWEGINIYESHGDVRVFVIPRPEAGAS